MLIGTLLGVGVATGASAREPVRARDWRPLTAADLALPLFPTPFWVMPGHASSAPRQWVRIDPATNEILSGPWLPDAQTAARPTAASPPMRLRTTSRGHLLLETRGWRSVMQARLDPDGELHVDCRDATHAHATGEAPIDGDAPGQADATR